MSMSELERARETRDAIHWAVFLLKREDLRAPPSPPAANAEAHDVAHRMHELWKREVNILEAAEEEPQAIDEPPDESEPQATIDRIHLASLGSRIAELNMQFQNHHHDGWRNGPVEGSTTGPLYG